MTTREKGVATKPCPTCSTDLPLTAQPDGGLSVATCPKCYDAPKSEKAGRARTRERGTEPTATSTDTTQES